MSSDWVIYEDRALWFKTDEIAAYRGSRISQQKFVGEYIGTFPDRHSAFLWLRTSTPKPDPVKSADAWYQPPDEVGNVR